MIQYLYTKIKHEDILLLRDLKMIIGKYLKKMPFILMNRCF